MSRKILIVEDEYDLALNLKEQVVKLGFIVPAVFDNAKETLAYLEMHQVDLLLVDVMITGAMDGIELVDKVNQKWDLPIIFSTAYADNSIFSKALRVKPEGYLVKPYKMDDLKTTLMLAFSKVDRTEKKGSNSSSLLKVREKGFTVFLSSNDIIMAKADGLYTKIFTSEKSYVMRDILKDVEEKLPEKVFLRVHKSYLINTRFIASFNGKFAKVGEYIVPLRRGLYTSLKKLLYDNNL